MHIAIDDTAGPDGATASTYVSDVRKTHVAVIFQDDEVGHVREQVSNCLDYLGSQLPARPAEFHFAKFYNRQGIWKHLSEKANLGVVDAFANIYRNYRWKVFIQTVDDRTVADRPMLRNMPGIDGLDPKNSRADMSLQLLCIKIRLAYKATRPPIRLLVDQGNNRAPGTFFGKTLFADWGEAFSGKYESSSAEPLIQIADFLAFAINRSTHLAMKEKRTKTDDYFLHLAGTMEIDCDELAFWRMSKDFTVKDFDAAHREDRRRKRLE